MAEQGLSRRLLDWYDRNRRSLPWRAAPGVEADPYRVWLSEIMLQQTTVAAVKHYFLKFVTLWPTVEALAAAPLDDVLRAWAGLGYYARARNLHACAKAVMARHGGRFPDTEAALLELPGIGPYTAAAVAAIAYGRPAAAMDGNAERVIARLRTVETPLPEAKPLLRKLIVALVPPDRPGDFAQALMDLGSTICTPRAANCLICPWSDECEARRRGIADSLPRKAPKRAQPVRKGIAFWIEHEGRVLLRRRPENGLLGGMMEIPSTPWGSALPRLADAHAPLAATWRRGAGRIEHTFTHFHLELDIWRAVAIADGTLASDHDYRWVPLQDLTDEALPTVMRKVVAAVAASPSAAPQCGEGDA